MIGNDIIDRRVVARHLRSADIRFRRKVLCAPEMDWLDTQEDPALALWQLWACKESAYKVYFQQTGHRFFAPKRLVCRSPVPCSKSREVEWLVETPAGAWPVKALQNQHFIHALCHPAQQQKGQVYTQFLQFDHDGRPEQSRTLRAAVIRYLVRTWDLERNYISWDDGMGFPQVRYQGKLLPCSLSMSHHGTWGSFVLLVPPNSGRE